jgi:hypothetical protein
MHEAFFFDEQKMLPHRIRAFESKVVRNLLQRRNKARFTLSILIERQHLPLPSCQRRCPRHTAQIYTI